MSKKDDFVEKVKKNKTPRVDNSKQDIRDRIVFSALELASQQGWVHTSLSDISAHAKVSLCDLYEYIDHKDDILALFARMVDKRVLANFHFPDSEVDGNIASAKDLIFDILMDRYEILNEYREGISAIIRSFKCDPKQAVIFMPHIFRSMSWVLESAQVRTSGISGALKTAGLTGVYLKVLKVWISDDSRDLSKTMAALDKALEQGESFTNSFGL